MALHWQGNIDRGDRRQLRAWLDTLPPVGIKESPTAVWDRFWRFVESRPKARHAGCPKPAGLIRWFGYHARFIASLGWTVGYGRTGKGRWISITRTVPNS